jgi:hypothetical protein
MSPRGAGRDPMRYPARRDAACQRGGLAPAAGSHDSETCALWVDSPFKFGRALPNLNIAGTLARRHFRTASFYFLSIGAAAGTFLFKRLARK